MNFDLNKYNEDGFILVDDFLPDEEANEVLSIFDSAEDWSHIHQIRENHYSHVFSTKSSKHPKSNEPYIAKFDRSEGLENHTRISELVNTKFNEALVNLSGISLDEFNHRCYRLDQGDHFRTHIDDYIGDIGCIYYINRDWRWDWGGILHVTEDSESEDIISIFPKFNRAMFINHRVFKFPHFVTQIAEHALKPRYTLLTFGKKQ